MNLPARVNDRLLVEIAQEIFADDRVLVRDEGCEAPKADDTTGPQPRLVVVERVREHRLVTIHDEGSRAWHRD